MPRTVAWDIHKLELLKAGHAQAKQERATEFSITVKPEGKLDLVTDFAFYMIQQLEADFAKSNYIPAYPNKEGEDSTVEETYG